MATRMLRRGLPRVAGGEPWPPAGEIEVAESATTDAAAAAPVAEPATADAVATAMTVGVATTAPAAEPVDASVSGDAPVPGPQPVAVSDAAGAASTVTLRRGLPRAPGGEPWPPSDAASVVAATPSAASPSIPASTAAAAPESGTVDEEAVGESKPVEPVEREASAPTASSGVALRRGLPRMPGGEPWPPAGAVAVTAESAAALSGASDPAVEASTSAESAADADAIPATTVATIDVSTPLPFQRTVFPGKTAFTRPAPRPEPDRIGPFTKGQWAGAVIIGGGGLLVAAAMAVLFVRWLLSLDPLQDWLTTYPGEYHLPEGAPVGFPAWLGWQHFFNVFLMVLIIRSGLRIRTEKRPTAFWTPRGNAKGKVSLTIWFHQALDILWLINGVVFIVLLFMTGQWMRVIPTSWEVFPNAISAVLQYISLDWPTENGWVNYNSIQQITYFTTIFIAAPLAAVTGFRMSGMWPKNAEKLNKAYPIEWARAVHFPVMLYFVVFIAIHVFLVMATGALRNLNHMYAAQGSTDSSVYADNWTGFWMLVASLVVIAAAWVAARPMVLAPIAKLFGTVSAR